ncbi:hypothetical protein PFICI_12881 [Pestalotiopsis fici W106-1]|uniref:Major facilitator superfamily (MFS) profile domain-containing protein n=1 Tax=Pestalotiopsis fici (strain W106-1 / CGMCC3.15140) TaxID=1229662 RepID=W3WS06_PESFW|nr:uncharacterized protein PFICI_12881 [Pestalotiopsis fici W106-1]ETS75937.1 hypothetical protein PFICI_12881 [Pestalotiopsis fici W106-1]
MPPISNASNTDRSIHVVQPKLRFWRRTNPYVQNLLITGCLAMLPGLYLAILGLGAGGGKATSIQMANLSNACLYAVYAVTGILGGTIVTVFGPRLTVAFACLGYPLFIGSLWYFDLTGRIWFPIFAGAFVGFCGACLWTTAGFMANAYAEESEKGAYRAIQWTGNALGATVGAVIALGINYGASTPSTPAAVYIVFIVLQILTLLLAAMMVSPERLRRQDGTTVAEFKASSFKDSLRAMVSMFKDWRMLLLLPAFFTPEAFIVLQSSLNAYAFNLRTRSLNNFLNYIFQIPSALFVGYFILDNNRLGSRRRRGLLAIGFNSTLILGTYVALTIWLHSWNFNRNIEGPMIDLKDAAYPGAVVIYILYGAQYGIFQNTVLWLVGSLSNQPGAMAHMGGIFVGILSAGTAVSFGIDAAGTDYQVENAIWFALNCVCWPIMAFVTWKYVTKTNYSLEDGVTVPTHALQDHHSSDHEVEKATIVSSADAEKH